MILTSENRISWRTEGIYTKSSCGIKYVILTHIKAHFINTPLWSRISTSLKKLRSKRMSTSLALETGLIFHFLHFRKCSVFFIFVTWIKSADWSTCGSSMWNCAIVQFSFNPRWTCLLNLQMKIKPINVSVKKTGFLKRSNLTLYVYNVKDRNTWIKRTKRFTENQTSILDFSDSAHWLPDASSFLFFNSFFLVVRAQFVKSENQVEDIKVNLFPCVLDMPTDELITRDLNFHMRCGDKC